MKKLFGIIVGAIFSIWGLFLFIPAIQVIGKTGRYTWKPPYSEYEQAALDARFWGITLFIVGLTIMLVFAIYIYVSAKNKKENSCIDSTTHIKNNEQSK